MCRLPSAVDTEVHNFVDWSWSTKVNPIHPIGNSLKKQKPCTKVNA